MRPGVDYIGVGVGALIIDDAGRLFMAKRGPQAKNERGLWEFPGGGVEFGEQLQAALIREIEEEYGIIIHIESLFTVTDHILPDENQHWVSPSYLCSIVEGTPVIREPEKCSAIGWFALDEIPSDITVVSQHDLALYRARFANTSKMGL